jgi:hypothetical protein
VCTERISVFIRTAARETGGLFNGRYLRVSRGALHS